MGKRGIVLALALAFSGRTVAGSDAVGSRVHMRYPPEQKAVQWAVQAAAKLLAEARCQQIFDDFKDGSGRPLRAKLAELGVSGANYIDMVRFDDGAGQAGCSRPGMLAITQPGSRVVFVCARLFQREYDKDRRAMQAVVIH